MDYAEAAYFDGYQFQHIAAWYEAQRQKRIRAGMHAVMGRRQSPR